MTTQAVTPQIEGLPPGAIVGPPLQSSGAQIEGLPAGAIVGPPLGQTLQSQAAGPEPTLSDTQIPAGPLSGFTVGQVVGGAKETGQDIWSAIKAAPMALTGGAGTAGSTIYENIKESIPVIHAYETARSQGKGVIDSLSAANDEAKRQQDARNVLKQRIEEFKANPGQESIRAIGDAAALAASIYAGSKIPLNPEAAAAEAGEEATGAEAAAQPKSPGIMKQVVEGQEVAQEPAKAALKGAGSAVAQETGAEGATELRESLSGSIDASQAKADELYKQIDDASGADFKSLGQKLKVANRNIRQAVSDADEAKATADRDEIEGKIEAAKQTAMKNGVDPKVLDEADAHFKRMSALSDVEKKVYKNVNVVDPTTGEVNVNAAVKQLQKLQDMDKFGAPRLEQAFGSGNTLLEDLKAANRLGMKAMTRQQWAKAIGKYAGIPSAIGLAGAAYEALK